MVLGLGGTALPPRPAKRHVPGGSAPAAAGAAAPESSLARVHSNSHLAAALAAAGTHTVDTPSAEQQTALPAASGQSNVRGGAAWRVHEGHQEAHQEVQQMAQAQRPHEQSASECDQPSPLAPRLQQVLQQQVGAQQQQQVGAQQQQQQGLAELQPPPQGSEQASLWPQHVVLHRELIQLLELQRAQWRQEQQQSAPQQTEQQEQQEQQQQQQQQQAQPQPQQEQQPGQDARPVGAEQQQVQQQSAPKQTERQQQSAPEQAQRQAPLPPQQQQDPASPAEQAAEEAAGTGRKRRAEQPPADGPQSSRPRRSRLGAAEAAAAPADVSAGDAAAAGGRRGSLRLAAAGGAGTTPPAKRQKPASSAASKGASGASGGTKAAGGKGPGGRSKFADVLHRVVAVPGSIFYVDTPGKFFYGQVTKSEPKRKVPAVEVLFFDDDSKYWFPVADVRRWMAEMAAAAPHQPHAWGRHNPGVPPPGPEQQQAAEGQEGMEAEAAMVLQSLSVSIGGSQLTGSRAERAGQEPAVSSGGKGRRRASGAAREGSRERPASRGGRPGAGGAAAGRRLRRTDSQERREGALMAAVQAESR